jgi:hypothetical protein
MFKEWKEEQKCELCDTTVKNSIDKQKRFKSKKISSINIIVLFFGIPNSFNLLLRK